MRYDINQKVWAIGFILSDKDSKKLIDMPYFTQPLNKNVKVESFKFYELVIKEHHTVPLAKFSESKEHDGFVAVDQENNIWYNQYPLAEYGNDESDKTFELKEFDDLCESVKDYDKVFNDIVKRNLHPSIYDFCKYLNLINGGVLNEDKTTLKQSRSTETLDHFNELVLEFTKRTGLIIEQDIKEWISPTKTIYILQWKIV